MKQSKVKLPVKGAATAPSLKVPVQTEKKPLNPAPAKAGKMSSQTRSAAEARGMKAAKIAHARHTVSHR